MFKERIVDHLKSTGQGQILKDVRKHEGPNVGVDDVSITPDEALAAGINKYHLPKTLAQKLSTPAIEATITYAGNTHPLDPVVPRADEASRIVITEESLKNH